MPDLREWLAAQGLGQYADAFAANDVDLDVAPLLDDADLERLGLSLGHRKRFRQAIAALGRAPAQAPAPTPAADAPGARTSGPERRQLTVMFCDLADSTRLSAALDPEDFQGVLGEFRRCCAAAIEDAQGYVAKYMGDGLLAYFGYPQARADAADRAVHAGLAVAAAVRGCASAIALDVRVGIATGEVVVGEQIGVDASREWSVVGDAPNLAARLQAAARPGEVLVAELTRRLTRQGFGWSAPLALTLKGFADTVTAYAVTDESRGGDASETAAAGAPRTLVGRSPELALLSDRLDRIASADAQIVLLVGEAGIGKSALARALVEKARAAGFARTLFQCSPFRQNSELHPFAVRIERDAGIVRSGPAEVNLRRLEAWLARDGTDSGADLALFAALLSLPAPPGEPLADLTPQALRAKTLARVQARLLGSDRDGPALLVLEDGHWLDPTSAELLARLVNHLGSRRIMLLVTARPDFDAKWSRHPGVTMLTLSRLAPRDGRALVAEIPGARALAPEFVEQLVARAEGNPLFIEELAKSFAETLAASGPPGAGGAALERMIHVIPTSLRDLLAERLDRLGPAKETAQAAAVIGQEFDARLLEAISDAPGSRANDLVHLVDAQIVVRRGGEAATTYAFRHALIQEAAYQSLLKSRRRGHHRRIAESLERGVVPELADRAPELIAQHYAEAGVADRAIDCWLRSGMHAAERSANMEAIRQLSAALDLVREQPPSPERAGKELSLLIALGPTLQATRGWDALKVRDVYDAALALARETARSAELFPALWGRWLIAHASGDAPGARELLAQLADVAEEIGDPDLMLQLHHAAGSTSCTDGVFAVAIERVRACIAAYDIDRHRHQAMRYGGHDPCVCTTCIGALAQFIVGHRSEAAAWSADAFSLARRLEHSPSIAHAQVYQAELGQIRGEAGPTMRLADNLLAIGIDKGLSQYVAWAKMSRGWALASQGETDRGIGEMEEGLQALRRTGVRYHLPHRLGMRAQAYATAGRRDDALGAIDEALASSEATGEQWYTAELLRLKAAMLADAGGGEGAIEALLGEAIDHARQRGAKLWECRASIDLAQRLARASRFGAARDVLAPALAWGPDVDIAERAEAQALHARLSG